MSLVKKFATVASGTLVSRILGFLRDILIAAVLGTGMIADAFVVAFRMPNLFRRLFAEGAFNAAFVPLFAKRLETEGAGTARTFAEEALAGLFAVLLLVTALAQIFMPFLVLGLAPGFASEPEKLDLATALTRIAFPYLMCMSLVALLSGLLNSLHRYMAAAAAPIVLNVVLVSVMLFAHWRGYHEDAAAGYLLVWGVAVAGVLQLAMLWIAAKRAGYALRLGLPRMTEGVRRLVALALPSPLGYVQEQLTGPEKLVLATAPYASTKALLDDVLLAVIDELAGDAAPRDRVGFEALRDRASAGLMDGLFGAAGLTARVLTAAKEADKAISRASSLAFMGSLADARSQLDALVHPGFVRTTGLAQLARAPLYLAGIRHRAEKLADNPGRDRAWQTQVEEATALYRAAGGELPLTPTTPARLVPVRWMLEELRLSLFAQHLGAAGPVSVQRIRKAIDGS